MPVSGPWYITITAAEEYLRLLGRPVTDETRARATEELAEIAARTVVSGRRPRRLDSGALRYRGPRPGRLGLIVVEESRPEGRLPQLVRVLGPYEGA